MSVYFTAGFPSLHSTIEHAVALEQAGVDFIELGFPFSDPTADGPVIQQSSQEALHNGMNLKLLFSQLAVLRQKVQIPVILMGYLNPVLQFGVESFLQHCQDCGIDGLILPDLPLLEYEEHYKSQFESHGISNIFMVSPQTSDERIRQIDALSTAFIYVLSSSSITGGQLDTGLVSQNWFQRLENLHLRNPLMVGFGINSPETFAAACKQAAGAIVGTAFINALRKGQIIQDFVTSIRGKNNEL